MVRWSRSYGVGDLTKFFETFVENMIFGLPCKATAVTLESDSHMGYMSDHLPNEQLRHD